MRHPTPLALILLPACLGAGSALALDYPIVSTHQSVCYDDRGSIPCPQAGSPWAGQDAQFQGAGPSYRVNGDGTVSDEVTGLTWVQARGPETSWDDAVSGAAACRVGGHDDWRMPTVKELYSLIDFRGRSGPSAGACVPYLDAGVFGFTYGDSAKGERVIDAQDWSATEDGARTMGGDHSVFGVNFIDGRIKAYPKWNRRKNGPTLKYCRYVRGNPAYGRNRFVDHGDGTVMDEATGLEWSRDDSGRGMDWPGALAWVHDRDGERYLGHDDWRLPSAKELQSLVDYTRGPDISGSAAIDPLFHCSTITDEAGLKDYPYVWSSTSHRDSGGAVYVCFGRAMGWMRGPDGEGRWMDVHGAGAQRSDPKTGDPLAYPHGRGPQGDAIRILNYVRLVRGGGVKARAGEQDPAAEAPRGGPPSEGTGPDGGTGPNGGSGPDSGRRVPPQEAIDACQGHAPGDSVSFSSPHGDTVQGVCRQRGGLLFAVPDQRP
jgi:hypothetical protein